MMGTWCVLSLAIAASAVYRCPGADGAPLFTDRPCADGVVQSIEHLSVVAPAALTADERARLDAIATGPPGKKPPARARSRSPVRDREAACDAARATLASLREQRRRGYRVSESASLDSREQAARATAEATCGMP